VRARRSGALPAVAVALALALAGCGGDDAGDLVSETAGNLGEIRSGDLRFELDIEPRGLDENGRIRIALEGPFALRGPGRLPVARIRYTQVAGDQQAEATLISTGEDAYVEVDGAVTPLTAEQEAELLEAGGSGGGGLDALGLDIEDWLDDPQTEDGPEVGGDETDRVSAGLDLAAALEDAATAARRAGAEAPVLEEGARAALEDAVRSDRVELLTGADDRLLRRLEAEVDLEGPEELRPLLGLEGARVSIVVEIANPNRDVTVADPTG
jgi:hypothetical protein